MVASSLRRQRDQKAAALREPDPSEVDILVANLLRLRSPHREACIADVIAKIDAAGSKEVPSEYTARIGLPYLRATLHAAFNVAGSYSTANSALEAIASTPSRFKSAATALAYDRELVDALAGLLSGPNELRDQARQAFAALASIGNRGFGNLALSNRARVIDLLENNLALGDHDLEVIAADPWRYEGFAERIFDDAARMVYPRSNRNSGSIVESLRLLDFYLDSPGIPDVDKRDAARVVGQQIRRSQDSNVVTEGVRVLWHYARPGYATPDSLDAIAHVGHFGSRRARAAAREALEDLVTVPDPAVSDAAQNLLAVLPALDTVQQSTGTLEQNGGF